MSFADERRTIDLRTFRSREEALSAPPTPEHSIQLVCVRDLDAIVDRKQLLTAPAELEPPYWALPWIGARAIASTMLGRPPASSHRVLDLGCGLGLAGAAASIAGAHVAFVDHVEDALTFARANATLHRLAHYETHCLDFTRERLDERFDWVLAADIVYDPAHYLPLAEFLDTHLAAAGTLLVTESLRADARVVLEQLARRRICGSKKCLWLIDEGRPELTYLHILARE